MKRFVTYTNFVAPVGPELRALDERLVVLWNDPSIDSLEVTRGMQAVEPRWTHQDTRKAVNRLRINGVSMRRRARPRGIPNKKSVDYQQLRDLAKRIQSGE